MKYIVETSYPKGVRSRRVFTPGWYGDKPYFKCSSPSSDGTGRQHLTLSIQNADDPSIDGNSIGMTHVPSGWIMITKEEYERLQINNND